MTRGHNSVETLLFQENISPEVGKWVYLTLSKGPKRNADDHRIELLRE